MIRRNIKLLFSIVFLTVLSSCSVYKPVPDSPREITLIDNDLYQAAYSVRYKNIRKSSTSLTREKIFYYNKDSVLIAKVINDITGGGFAITPIYSKEIVYYANGRVKEKNVWRLYENPSLKQKKFDENGKLKEKIIEYKGLTKPK